MKKQLWLKIVLNILLCISIISCAVLISIYTFYIIENIRDLNKFSDDPWLSQSVKQILTEQYIYSFFISLTLITNIAIFIFLNFKDFSYLTESMLKQWKDGKAKREEEKKAKLQAEIAEKQALLDKLNKE